MLRTESNDMCILQWHGKNRRDGNTEVAAVPSRGRCLSLCDADFLGVGVDVFGRHQHHAGIDDFREISRLLFCTDERSQNFDGLAAHHVRTLGNRAGELARLYLLDRFSVTVEAYDLTVCE